MIYVKLYISIRYEQYAIKRDLSIMGNKHIYFKYVLKQKNDLT